MTCSRLLKKMILGVTLVVYTSVQSLETGYEYTNEHAERDDLYKDLKCGYLYGGYTYVRVIKLLFGEPYRMQLNVAIGTISHVNDLVKTQVATLIDLKERRIGAMWTLHLFTSLISSFYQISKDSPQSHQNVFESLVYVIDKLNDDLVGCRKGNSFDSYDDLSKSVRQMEFADIKQRFLKHLMDKGWELLHKNHNTGDCVLNGNLEITLRLNWLFLSNLGVFQKLKDDLQNVYNLKIAWNDTGTVLYSYWRNARDLDWKTTNLVHIKKYFNACFNYLKIIMFRLTTKHMAYLRPFVADEEAFKYYAQKWYNIVVRFGALLNLSEDLYVKNLLHVLENLINGIEKIDGVVSYIAVKLVTLCQPFGCKASDPFVMDNREFTITYTGLNPVERQLLKKTFSPVWIEYYSLENANVFLSHLKFVFKKVNFTVIRSLSDYIDELNPTIWAQRSDDCSEELEHLINISDFE